MKVALVAVAVPAVAVGAALLLSQAADQAQAAGHMPKADAQALWDHLQKEKYQTSYKLWPGKDKMYKGAQPHGAFLTTYVNDAAHKALTEGTGPLPVGSVVVKENYMPDKKLAAVTVMYKASGFDPQNNDWYWLKRNADGKVEASGKVESCIACHKPSQRDYLLTPIKK